MTRVKKATLYLLTEGGPHIVKKSLEMLQKVKVTKSMRTGLKSSWRVIN